MESVVIWPLLSALTTTPTFSLGAWFSRYEERKLGFTAWMTSAEIRKEFAYVWLIMLGPHGPSRQASQMRSMVLGRKLPRAPWRRREPISSSSKTPTSFIRLLDLLSLEARRASMADQEHSLSSIRPPNMNSLSRPPTCAGWMSYSSSSQLMMDE